VNYRFCKIGTDGPVVCDGIDHGIAIFDEELGRWVHVDERCPHRAHNREVIAAERR
jgi:hypothetical protein